MSGYAYVTSYPNLANQTSFHAAVETFESVRVHDKMRRNLTVSSSSSSSSLV